MKLFVIIFCAILSAAVVIGGTLAVLDARKHHAEFMAEAQQANDLAAKTLQAEKDDQAVDDRERQREADKAAASSTAPQPTP